MAGSKGNNRRIFKIMLITAIFTFKKKAQGGIEMGKKIDEKTEEKINFLANAGLTQREIADILDISESSVRTYSNKSSKAMYACGIPISLLEEWDKERLKFRKAAGL